MKWMNYENSFCVKENDGLVLAAVEYVLRNQAQPQPTLFQSASFPLFAARTETRVRTTIAPGQHEQPAAQPPEPSSWVEPFLDQSVFSQLQWPAVVTHAVTDKAAIRQLSHTISFSGTGTPEQMIQGRPEFTQLFQKFQAGIFEKKPGNARILSIERPLVKKPVLEQDFP